MVEPTCQLVQNLKNTGKDIRIIQCNDGGENKALENRMNSSDWKMGPIACGILGQGGYILPETFGG
jgi:hypothetical protein